MARNGNKNAPSSMQQPINLCRCCLADGCYKDISTEYFTNGQKEVYAAMLLETFNISISYQEGGGPSSESRLICDDCIARLRDSHQFKKMVLHSEDTFREQLERLRKPLEESAVEVKLESYPVIDLNDGSSDEFNVEVVGQDIADDSLSNIKIEGCKTEPMNFTSEDEARLVIEEAPTKKRRSNRKRMFKTEEGQIMNRKSKSGKEIVQDFQDFIEPSCSEPTDKGDTGDSDATEPYRKVAVKETHAADNTLKLLKYSNATLFLWGQSTYRCFCCKKRFRDLSQLRKHCATHPWVYIEKKMNRHQGLKKADISSLSCKLCSAGCGSLNELMGHLDVHEIQFDNSGHLLMPFRLGSGRFVCEFCQEDCELFERLAIHMHRHFNTFECDLCGAVLSSEKSILDHKKRCHRRNTF